jgi:hypothetical protein
VDHESTLFAGTGLSAFPEKSPQEMIEIACVRVTHLTMGSIMDSLDHLCTGRKKVHKSDNSAFEYVTRTRI